MHTIARREFLQALAAAVPLVHTDRQATGASHIVVIGAGLAGLAAASELREQGRQVTVLEARTRAGGRVHTLREPFSDGLYAEAGAARIQDSHHYTLRYVKRFNLTLDPFWPTDGHSVMRVGGQRLVVPQGSAVDLAQVPLAFTDEERKAGLRGGLAKYLFSHLKGIGDPTAPGWPATNLDRYEVPLLEFCRKNGASDAFVRMIGLGHDLSGMSALHFLRDVAMHASTKQWFKIRGGNDRLPFALAATMSDVIRYGAPVVRIAQAADEVRVTYMRDRTPVTLSAQYVISTIPAPVLATVEITPEPPERTREAIRELGSLDMARVHLQTSRRFWLARNDTGWGSSDDPMDVWDYTRDQPGQRGILGAYLSGHIARQVSGMDETERGRFILERMDALHPGTREHFEASASYCWISDRWARGASAEFRAGHMTRYYHALRAPVGRIHFAGEHTSLWSGWMNGALESGHRAAAEVLARG